MNTTLFYSEHFFILISIVIFYSSADFCPMYVINKQIIKEIWSEIDIILYICIIVTNILSARIEMSGIFMCSIDLENGYLSGIKCGYPNISKLT